MRGQQARAPSPRAARETAFDSWGFLLRWSRWVTRRRWTGSARRARRCNGYARKIHDNLPGPPDQGLARRNGGAAATIGAAGRGVTAEADVGILPGKRA